MKSICVSGSNGKGSTVTLIAAIFKAHGVGGLGVCQPQPSPSWPFSEVCEVDGVSTELYCRTSPFDRLRAAGARLAIVEGTDVAHGEVLERKQVGGTHWCWAPMHWTREDLQVGVITTICDDANQPAINRARLKAGVLARTNVPLVVGDVPADCRALIEQVARARGARLTWALDDVTSAISDFTDGRAAISVRTPVGSYTARLQSRGRYQLHNATVAIRVAELCGVPRNAICAGLEAAEPLGGRLQIVKRGDQTILIDFMKNPAGAMVLATYLRERHPGCPIVVRLKGYRTEVADILSEVGPVSFDGPLPDADFVTVAGPVCNDVVP